MKIELELSDFEEIYYACDEEITAADIKKIIVDAAIEKFVTNLYNSYISDTVYDTIKNDAKTFVKEHGDEIVNKIVEKVSNEIMRKKAIANSIPKKSELTKIDKEWEEYFVGLVDKAIAKRFK